MGVVTYEQAVGKIVEQGVKGLLSWCSKQVDALEQNARPLIQRDDVVVDVALALQRELLLVILKTKGPAAMPHVLRAVLGPLATFQGAGAIPFLIDALEQCTTLLVRVSSVEKVGEVLGLIAKRMSERPEEFKAPAQATAPAPVHAAPTDASSEAVSPPLDPKKAN